MILPNTLGPSFQAVLKSNPNHQLKESDPDLVLFANFTHLLAGALPCIFVTTHSNKACFKASLRVIKLLVRTSLPVATITPYMRRRVTHLNLPSSFHDFRFTIATELELDEASHWKLPGNFLPTKRHITNCACSVS